MIVFFSFQINTVDNWQTTDELTKSYRQEPTNSSHKFRILEPIYLKKQQYKTYINANEIASVSNRTSRANIFQWCS